MSSLAAARADNFYYPPHFDPVKHGTLAKVRLSLGLEIQNERGAPEGLDLLTSNDTSRICVCLRLCTAHRAASAARASRPAQRGHSGDQVGEAF